MREDKVTNREDPRIKKIYELIEKFVTGDFSGREEITGKGDETDAIIAGLNVLAEEMEASRATEKKHLQAAEESEKRFRSLIQSAPDAVITIDENSVIFNWNRQAEILFGWTAEEVLGKTLPETIIPERYHQAHLKGLKHFLLTGEGPVLNRPVELEGRRKDNTEFPLELKISALKEKDKYIFIGFIRDISLRKQNEEEIRKLTEHLEKNIAELENANKELESFSYTVAHHLRAPLRAINGFTQILKKRYATQMDDEGKRLMSVVTSSSIKLGRLIDALLEFSRFGKKEIERMPVDTSALVGAVLEELDPPSWNPRAKIILKELLPVMADSILLERVLANLITNALKFSRIKPAPVVEIGSFAKENEIVFYVKDNGVGFDMQYYEKLFKVFQTVHSPEEYEGTGIGLAMVQKIISRHGGKVWAEGKVNEGATFYFSLPKNQKKEEKHE